MYLFLGYCNLRVEAGLQSIFALHFTIFAQSVIVSDNRPITGGCLEVIIRKGWVAVLEGVLKCTHISYITNPDNKQILQISVRYIKHTVPPRWGGKYSGSMNVWTSDFGANFSLLIASGPNQDFTIFHAAGLRNERHVYAQNVWIRFVFNRAVNERKTKSHHSWSKAFQRWSFWLI